MALEHWVNVSLLSCDPESGPSAAVPQCRSAMYSPPVALCAPGPTLSAIRSVREAVRAGPGVHWNFATSRSWSTTPRWIAEELKRDPGADEMQTIHEVVRMDVPKETVQKTILCIVGPRGAGRSKMMSLLAQSFHLDISTFAQLDSHQIRGTVKGLAQYILDDHENGYLDADEIFTSNPLNEGLKVRYLHELLKAAKNVVYRDTYAQGYQLLAVALLISFPEFELRQRNEAEVTGQWPNESEKTWLTSMEHAVKVCQKADKALAFDMTDVFHPQRVYARGLDREHDELQATLESLKEDKSWQLPPREGHAWCECLSLEGVYRKEDGGTVEIVVPDPCKELAPVLLRPADGHGMAFSVKTQLGGWGAPKGKSLERGLK
eukprot:s284_g16.t1